MIVESDTILADKISKQIVSLGYQAVHSGTIGEAKAAIDVGTGDLLVLSAETHDPDHFETLSRLRISSDIPIIVTSSRDDLDSKLRILGLGVDDYITKPFDMRELQMRIHNILRRTSRTPSKGRHTVIDDLRIDLQGRTVIDRSGREHSLTRAEADLLRLLVVNEGITLGRAQLLDAKSADPSSDSVRRVDILISRLRRKMERDPSHPNLLITVRGIGYRLRKSVR
ncbi:MAG TPA: response regulator transcription factor [Dongiaceae bacterium]|nr:response regulator transcription factor [Dongiaceae bacterium]